MKPKIDAAALALAVTVIVLIAAYYIFR